MSDKKVQIYLLNEIPVGLNFFFKELEFFGYHLGYEYINQMKIAILPMTVRTDLSNYNDRIKKLKTEHPEVMIIGVSQGKLKNKEKDWIDAGVDQVFLMPLQKDQAINFIFTNDPVLITKEDLEFDHLQRVQIWEIEKLTKIPFDIYLFLPGNKRIVNYLHKDAPVESKLIEKFKANPNYNLYIKKTDLRYYNEYCSQKLTSLAANKSLNENEKIKALQGQLQNMMNPYFSEGELTYEESRQALEGLNRAFNDLSRMTEYKIHNTEDMQKLAYQKMTSVSHSQNVAIYCSLFGMMCGINRPGALRLGGLLHDIGLADIGPELVGRRAEEMSEEERSRYQLHPGNAKQELSDRKIQVDQDVYDMILFHHERLDGSGYPYGKKKNEIPATAKICAFADEYDKLTSVRPGYVVKTPAEAMAILTGPNSNVFDPDLMEPLVRNFANKKSSKSTTKYLESGRIYIQSQKDNLKNKTQIANHQNQNVGHVSVAELSKMKSLPICDKKEPRELTPEMKAEADRMVVEMKKLVNQLVDTKNESEAS